MNSWWSRRPLHAHPWLAIPLVFGILVAFGALLLQLGGLAFGTPTGSTAPVEASYVPMFAHLGLVFAAGIYLPEPLVNWFQQRREAVGLMNETQTKIATREVLRWQRVDVDEAAWNDALDESRVRRVDAFRLVGRA